MNIIVTGGAGFLGTHLCRRLTKDGHIVTVLDLNANPEFETIIADVRDRESMKKYIKNTDAVFHLAAKIEAGESVKNPREFIDHNINGTLSVLDAMVVNDVKTILFSSTAAVYGEPIRVPIFEDDRTIPINPYGMTKLAVEGLLSSYVATHNITAIAMRYFNLFGPEEHHEPETHAIPRFIKQIYQDEPVTVWGKGEHMRDFIYISDVVEAHINALSLASTSPNQYHYCNLSSQKPASVLDVITLIGSIMEKEPQISYFPARLGDPLVLVADASKAHRILGWSASVDLETGLKNTIDYFLKSWTES
ncbi:MAG: NAD-dependent epimerase/dehydratase family protein [Microgenomates group bacterium]